MPESLGRTGKVKKLEKLEGRFKVEIEAGASTLVRFILNPECRLQAGMEILYSITNGSNGNILNIFAVGCCNLCKNKCLLVDSRLNLKH